MPGRRRSNTARPSAPRAAARQAAKTGRTALQTSGVTRSVAVTAAMEATRPGHEAANRRPTRAPSEVPTTWVLWMPRASRSLTRSGTWSRRSRGGGPGDRSWPRRSHRTILKAASKGPATGSHETKVMRPPFRNSTGSPSPAIRWVNNQSARLPLTGHRGWSCIARAAHPSRPCRTGFGAARARRRSRAAP